MKLIGKYRNGNYDVMIFDDGTKIRETEANDFVPEFSENCDVKLTDKCDQGCPFCYEGCTPEGKHADIDLKSPLFSSLHPYTELALNGNDMDHPQLEELLQTLKDKKVITNITLNQRQFEKNHKYVAELQKSGLVHGIGISLVNADDKFIELVKGCDNAVIHTICGILSESDISKLKNNGLKILILGYKNLKRGIAYRMNNSEAVTDNMAYLYKVLDKMPEWFKVVSFDNLAIEQLDVKRIMTDEQWDEFYMGDDGKYTFYIDLVKKEYAMNSLSGNRFPTGNKTVDEMFSHIRTLSE